LKFQEGDIIDEKYRIVRLIGEGGMGAVYEGRNVRIGRRVAIKVLHADFVSHEMKQRFEMEAQAAAKIGSPHICDVLDLGDIEGGHSYLVMEYLEGEGLDALMDRAGQMAPEQLSLFAFQMLEALGAMHAAGIIHRDIKPANMFVSRGTAVSGTREILKLLDFGISKFQTEEGQKQVTQTGALLGTPVYMAPEQARGEKVDGRSDLYSVGVVLYRALTGRLPFEGENFQQLLFKIALDAAPPIAELAPDVDEDFRFIVEKAMAKKADDRFQDAGEFQRALVAWAKIHGQSSLMYQKASNSKAPPAPSAQLLAAQASKRKPGLDEKSAPTAWGKGAGAEAGASQPSSVLEPKPETAKSPELVLKGAAAPDPQIGSFDETIEQSAPKATTQISAQAKTVDPAPAEKPKSKTALYAAIGVAAALAIFVGYKQIGHGADPAPAQSSQAATDSQIPSAKASVPVDVAPTATSTAAPLASAASSASNATPTTSAAPTAVAPTTTSTSRAASKAGATGAAKAPPTATTAQATATATATATAPATAPASSGRKIRTEL
jgi:serine/threonine-protein kinase